MSNDVVLPAEIEPGSYVVVRTGSLFGWLVRKFTHAPVDHAFVALGDGEIAEATIWGVRTGRLDSYSRHVACVDAGDALTGAQREQICAAARGYAGREYGWGAIALIALRLLGVRRPWLTRRLHDRDALICSEMVCRCGLAAGVSTWQCGEPDPEDVTPADLWRRPEMARILWS